MSTATQTAGAPHPPSLKERAQEEVREFLEIFTYLLVMFSGYTIYGILLEAGTGDHYIAFSFAVVEAFIGAKVMMLARHWNWLRRYEDQPLVYPALFKSVAFLGLMIAFSVVEHAVEAILHHRRLIEVFFEGTTLQVIMAKDLVIFLCLLPFFALREVGRVKGRWMVYKMFFDPGPEGQQLRALEP